LPNLNDADDAVGNVQTITDWLNSSQVATFGYDNLDRLTSAGTSAAGNGQYTESYAYDSVTGNLSSKSGQGTYTYTPGTHRVTGTSSNNNSYGYDANGNMTSRVIGGVTYTLRYDEENRLIEAKNGSTVIAAYTYDGDGQRVKSVVNGVATAFVGNYYEWNGTSATSYYYAGTTRLAMRQGSNAPVWLLGDHLGSTSVTVDASGNKVSGQMYMPWGETRPQGGGTVGTKYQFTGQWNEASIGLYYYGARWYDSALGRFAQPDTIVPEGSQGVQAWDRYAYTNNNPVRYNDPSGHDVGCGGQDASECGASTISPTGFVDNYGINGQAAALNAADKWYGSHPDYNIYQDSKVWTKVDGYLVPKPEYQALVNGYALNKAANGETGQLRQQMNAAAVAAVGGTYLLRDPDTMEVQYVGMTNDLARRAEEHRNSTDKSNLIFERDWETDSYAVQRGREQELYDRYNPPLNKIRPISDRNPNYPIYRYAAQNYEDDLLP
jgi:RHS repeat-associated protein